MSAGKPKRTPLEELAQQTARELMAHLEANTEEADARREAERDARVAKVLRELEAEGKRPPRRRAQ